MYTTIYIYFFKSTTDKNQREHLIKKTTNTLLEKQVILCTAVWA